MLSGPHRLDWNEHARLYESPVERRIPCWVCPGCSSKTGLLDVQVSIAEGGLRSYLEIDEWNTADRLAVGLARPRSRGSSTSASRAAPSSPAAAPPTSGPRAEESPRKTGSRGSTPASRPQHTYRRGASG